LAKRPYEENGVLVRPKEETLLFEEDNSWEFEMIDFYECIIGKRENVTGDIDDALKTMQLVEMIYNSAKN
jgi:predicted dehydrogenase